MRARAVELLAGLLAWAALGACAGGPDLVTLSPRVVAGPGLGAGLGLAQRLHRADGRRLEFEVELEHQEIDRATLPNGRVDDALDQVRVGLRLTEDRAQGWTGRGGVVWLRARGDADPLDATGDYGGAYVGVGRRFRHGARVAGGPELVAQFVASEGDGDSGWLVALAWRLDLGW